MNSIGADRKSTRLNSSHTVIYTLSLHDALPISESIPLSRIACQLVDFVTDGVVKPARHVAPDELNRGRSEEHTSELQSHSDLHSFPTRRSSDLREHSLEPYRLPIGGFRHRWRSQTSPACSAR